MPNTNEFRKTLVTLELAVGAHKNCPSFEDYIKGVPVTDPRFTKSQLECIVRHFLYPMLQTCHEPTVREDIGVEIKAINQIIGGC